MNLRTLASHTVDLDLLPEAPIVLDVGCRWFDFSRAVLKERPGATVFALDPARDVGNDLREMASARFHRVALIGTGHPMQRLAHFSTGEGDFLTTLEKYHDAEMYDVPCMTMHELLIALEVSHFDLVKLDCEGSEFSILENWPGPVATQISVEFHDWDKPQYRSETYYDRLWKMLPSYQVIQHDFSKQGTGVGHWDSLLAMRAPTIQVRQSAV